MHEVVIRVKRSNYTECTNITSIDVARNTAVGTVVHYRLNGRSEIFRTHPDQPTGPPRFLYSGYRVFAGDKVAVAWR